ARNKRSRDFRLAPSSSTIATIPKVVSMSDRGLDPDWKASRGKPFCDRVSQTIERIQRRRHCPLVRTRTKGRVYGRRVAAAVTNRDGGSRRCHEGQWGARYGPRTSTSSSGAYSGPEVRR